MSEVHRMTIRFIKVITLLIKYLKINPEYHNVLNNNCRIEYFEEKKFTITLLIDY